MDNTGLNAIAIAWTQICWCCLACSYGHCHVKLYKTGPTDLGPGYGSNALPLGMQPQEGIMTFEQFCDVNHRTNCDNCRDQQQTTDLTRPFDHPENQLSNINSNPCSTTFWCKTFEGGDWLPELYIDTTIHLSELKLSTSDPSITGQDTNLYCT